MLVRLGSRRSVCLYLVFPIVLTLLVIIFLYRLTADVQQISATDWDESDSLEFLLDREEPRNLDLEEMNAEDMISKLRQLSNKVALLEQRAVEVEKGQQVVALAQGVQNHQQLVAVPNKGVQKRVDTQCYVFKRQSPDDMLQPVDLQFKPVSNVKRKVVVLLTTMRAGSSFVGKMFAESEELMYFFEPFFLLEKLFPWRPWAFYDSMKTELLQSMLTCRFDSSIVSFRSIEAVSRGRPFPRDWSPTFVQPPFCPEGCQLSDCPPLDVSLVNKACLSKKVLMIKAIRVSDLNLLQSVVERVQNMDNAAELHVLHLVRDPRGTIHSRLKIRSLMERLYRYTHLDHLGEIPSLEEQVATNAEWLCGETLNQMTVAAQQPEWLRGRYLRVRFEDVANDAHGEMNKLYEHYGLKSSKTLYSWIEQYTKGVTPHGQVYGTWRKSEAVPFKWREMLKTTRATSLVKIVEEKCEKMMRKLGYIPEFL